MSSESIVLIKKIMDDIYELADFMDSEGISEEIPFIEDGESMRSAMRTDILLYIYRIVDSDKRITDDSVTYLNECMGVGLTKLRAEVVRKKSLEADVPKLSILLPYLIMLDKRVKETSVSTIYLRALLYITLGYLISQDSFSLEEKVAYYRYSSGCIELIEKALNIKVDFDPFLNAGGEYAELVKYAAEVDWEINNREKDPTIESLEKMLMDY